MENIVKLGFVGLLLGLATGCGPSVGDEFNGGAITRVLHLGARCYAVEYELPPEWPGCEDAATDLTEGQPESLALDDVLAEPTSLEPRSCGEMVEVAREGLRVAQRGFIDQMYQSALHRCLPSLHQGFVEGGQEVDWCSGEAFFGESPLQLGWGDDEQGGDDYYYDEAPTVVPSAADGADEFTTTNNQVAEVEEADYVKNDAGHVFVLTEDSLVVFDAWPVEEATEIARVPLEDEPRRLLLAGDRLVVFSRLPAIAAEGEEIWLDEAPSPNIVVANWEEEEDVPGAPPTLPASAPSDQGCTYGYDCRYQNDGGRTRLQVFDVTDPSTPSELTSYEFSGAYVAARRIDRTVHAVLHDAPSAEPRLLPGLAPLPNPTNFRAFHDAYSDLIGEMNAAVDAMGEDDLLVGSRAPDQGTPPQGCQDAFIAPGASGASFISLLTLDVDAPDQGAHRTIVASHSGYVYASAENLYLATDGVDGYTFQDSRSDASTLHKFALGEARSTYLGSAHLRGHVLNQFAMDEHEGVLRVASSSGWTGSDPLAVSHVSTFVQRGAEFGRLAELTGIAPEEDLRAVRFVGDRAYLVTFLLEIMQDPLFVVDLANPAEPTLLGELEIPGFSTYVHPVDRDHLITIGVDDDTGGIRLQMFDVSNPDAPVQSHVLDLGGSGYDATSEALTNHLAFTYFPSRGLLAVPLTVCDYYYGNGTAEFQGVAVFDVSIGSGFVERGRLAFPRGSNVQSSDDGYEGCYSWWSNSTSAVKRSIFFEDYLVALSDAELKGAHVDALESPLVMLPLAGGALSAAPQGP